MAKLYLVQHGKQVPEEENPEEPLSQEGKMDCEKAAKFAEKAGVKVSDIFHSMKLRAKETAEIYKNHIMPGGELSEQQGLKPMDDVEAWPPKIEDHSGDLMLVGHMPFMQKLSSLLITGDTDKPVYQFQQGGILCMEKNEEGNWIINFAVNPELL
jgi:phosphohistidine phosphatase